MLRYLSAMKYCAVVAGNSSSGVVETPSLGVPCVNVGDRQKGGCSAPISSAARRTRRLCMRRCKGVARLCRAGPASEKPLQRRRHQRAHRAAAGGVRAEPVA
ncbi:MAG: UDP-N-acetylglucosamine 2-epimerase [Ruthenibacterium lactatiformans]